jgi:hypothetical protein
MHARSIGNEAISIAPAAPPRSKASALPLGAAPHRPSSIWGHSRPTYTEPLGIGLKLPETGVPSHWHGGRALLMLGSTGIHTYGMAA